MGIGEDILVVKRDALFGSDEFQGFLSRDERDFTSAIMSNFEYATRTEELENDGSIQQIIPYVWLINPDEKKVFLYTRSGEGEEGRLHNKYSGGVGGHIDRKTEENSDDPIKSAMMRELKEEVVLNNYPVPRYVGYLNDDSEDVGKVHFGIVAIGETNEDVKPNHHMDSGRFYSVEEVDSLFADPGNDVEKWTQLSWPFVKSFLEK